MIDRSIDETDWERKYMYELDRRSMLCSIGRHLMGRRWMSSQRENHNWPFFFLLRSRSLFSFLNPYLLFFVTLFFFSFLLISYPGI